MKPLLIAAASLAACSSPEPVNNETRVEAAANLVTQEPSAGPAVSTAAAAPARPGELKTFRDWTVGCDNGLRCTMASLGPEAGDFPAMTVALTRAAGPDGGYEIALEGLEDATPRPEAIVIDGRRFAIAGDGLSGDSAAQVAAALANGRLMAIHGAGNSTIATVSTAGASAALRYIDATQGRVNTVTATVAKGAQQPVSVPRPPALPVIAAVTVSGKPATPTATQLAQMRKTGKCEGMAVEQSDLFKPDTHALGGGKTLVMVPCSSGAYNLFAALFVLEDGKFSQAKTDAETGFAENADVTEVVNGEWDGETLKTYAKGRGLGDCGVAQSFVWDGARLRLTEQSEMDECRGNPNYITTWRARVKRK
ncbi:DUF1176 domain-containing protein [Sphingomonas sp. SUN019]|uniref:DUF1176 domain-containing protein n=1 Tax=Sphingomonas sp. SUN019 TaxID=2937788 RepID=UPI002164270A|nr:DUF1176 domain-containing protein [Sphingomonas sp. SUN019]UVO50780.1 DUF1176 domain-containing protein [Sphingomonas sp. SUN019]